MTDDGRVDVDSLTLAQLQRIDAVCARFEAESEGLDRPTIETYLVGFMGVERGALLRELLALDLELREQRGDNPKETDYAHLAAAGDQTVVRDVFDATRVSEPKSPPKISLTPTIRLEIGSQIGPYQLQKCLGEGGMGTVYLAEQHEPISRHVVLKVVKSDLSSKKIIERFQQERQALAAMDHPNVARVLDAGTSEDNTPYFVMELVDGLPITDYCNQHAFGIRERLHLFTQVCQAVQHAHQKGIIHRDLKPSNVLVTSYDNQPVPKVIDFGLATAIREGVIGEKSQTDAGTVMGTFQYMSPEQADTGNADVDTRSDVYSLGVLLYELLTGDTPLSKQDLQNASYFEILRQIREADTRAPSRTAIQENDPSAAHQRGASSVPNTRWLRHLRGELDWITLRTGKESQRPIRHSDGSGGGYPAVLE